MGNNILLSICIPTYNRSNIIDKSLENYVNDPAFSEQVEIVISDNCSTDDTEKQIAKYTNKYNNIKYNRLQRNIGAEYNVIEVLSMGKGLYLKLMNDAISLKPGMLKSMLEILNVRKNEMKPIFFYQNIHFLNSNRAITCSNLNELISNTSFLITWIGNFGIWRNDFDLMEDKDRCADLLFPHTDWALRLMDKKHEFILLFDDHYNVAIPKSKGGYNIFKTFAVDYLSMFDEYIKSSTLNRRIYNTEKFRLFRYFLIGLYRKLVILKDENLIYEKENAINYLMKNYRTKPYFYAGLILLGILSTFDRIKKLVSYNSIGSTNA